VGYIFGIKVIFPIKNNLVQRSWIFLGEKEGFYKIISGMGEL